MNLSITYQVQVSAAAPDGGTEQVHRLLDEFEAAIAGGELRAYYQMLVSAHGRSVRGVEALVRWEHPENGLMAPGLFLPIVENSPLISSLTDWVLGEALRQCAAWRSAGWVVPVSVNLSVTLVSDPSLPGRVAEALADHCLPGHLLTLEVTETAIMNGAAPVAQILAELRRQGVRLSVDDFGTGYTSLALLKQFRFDELKIDRSFISGVRTDQNDSAIVRSVLGLGHLLGLDVVAEGVEDGETANWLAEIGCDVLQGFHFARPVPPANLEAAFNNSGQLGEGRVRYVSEQGARAGDGEPERPWAPGQSAPRPSSPRATVPGSAVPGAAVPAVPGAAGPGTAGPAALSYLQPGASLGQGAELDLGDVAALACAVLGVPHAIVTTFDGSRHWAGGQHGLDVVQLPTEDEFWAYTMASGDVMEVPDARYDDRFATAGLVIGFPYVRFYAGVPLYNSDGRPLGALRVMDTKPHTLTEAQRGHLRTLGRLAVRHVEARRADLLQQRVTARVEQLTKLHRAPDAASAAQTIVDVAKSVLQSSGACLLLADAAGAVTFRVAAVTGSAHTLPDLAHLLVDSRDDGAINVAVQTREPVFVADVRRSEMVDPKLSTMFDMASVLYLPVATEDAVVGTIIGWWEEPEAEVQPYTATLVRLLVSEAATTLSRLRALAELRAAAETDPLTGLANRRGFVRELHMLPPGSALVMMDLDNFRAVNDRHGHQAGDQVLKSFAAHLRSVLRTGDVAARWGGEEYAIALPSCDMEGASRVVQRLRQSWAPSDLALTSLTPTTFSTGLVALRERETPEQALDRADVALAGAKADGRDRDRVQL